MPVSVCSRRAFLQSGAAFAASTSCALAQAGTQRAEFIASIEKVTLRRGRDGSGPTWFHPRCCVVPTTSGSMVLMTLQTIAGSDYFGPVHSMTTRDLGKTWTDPQPVPPLGRVQPGNNLTEEGVCDVTPEWHPQTKSVL
ncbi:MAG: exo-alpha-sialidase, partial [Verrucomicrobia bacterium]|nr:exo-alpha-sialidase [Verrucomicrobiota bacterium]